MLIGIVGYKGGVGKTTTAIHLAAYLNTIGPSLLVDADPNRSALEWSKRGRLPFPVVGPTQAAKRARDFEHIVFDSKARMESDELRELAESVDALVLPTTPDALGIQGLMLTVGELHKIGVGHFRILLSIIPPAPSRDGLQARDTLADEGLPVFEAEVRRYVAYQKAALAGTTVADVRDAHNRDAWSDFTAAGKELLQWANSPR